MAKTASGDRIIVACVSASKNKFAEKRLPTKAELDKVAPANPLILAFAGDFLQTNSTDQRAGTSRVLIGPQRVVRVEC